MVEMFSNFTTTVVIIAALVSIGIVFEEKFIALEDKFDKWFEGVRKNVRK